MAVEREGRYGSTVELPPIIPASPPPHPQLTPEHLRQVAVAREGLRKIRRAVAVAQFDGVTLALFAAITVVMNLTSPHELAIALAMGLAAFIELRGVNGLRQLDPQAARTLGLNQLFVAAALIVYCVWRIYAEPMGAGISGALNELGVNDAVVKDTMGDAREITRMLVTAVYGAVIAVAFFAQGGLAIYYFSRRRLIEAYLADTPPWVIQLQKAGGTL